MSECINDCGQDSTTHGDNYDQTCVDNLIAQRNKLRRELSQMSDIYLVYTFVEMSCCTYEVSQLLTSKEAVEALKGDIDRTEHWAYRDGVWVHVETYETHFHLGTQKTTGEWKPPYVSP